MVKLTLFIGLIVAAIETLLNWPFMYRILKEEAMKYPVGENADPNIIALSTVISIIFAFCLIALGFIGVLKENASTMIAFAIIMLIGVGITVYTFHDHALVIIAGIIDLVFALVAFFYAYLIIKLNKRI